MGDIYYPSEAKYNRAKAAVTNYERLSAKKPGLVDYKLVADGLEQKLAGEKLVDFVYQGLGGAPSLAGAVAKEAKQAAEEARARTRKRQNEAVGRRTKTAVK